VYSYCDVCSQLFTSCSLQPFCRYQPTYADRQTADTTGLSQYHVPQFQTYAILRIKKWNNIFDTRAEFFPCRDETTMRRSFGEYCWAITQAAGRSCCNRSDSSVLVFGFRVVSVVCTCMYTIVDHRCSQFRRAQNWTWAGLYATYLLRQSGSVSIWNARFMLHAHFYLRDKSASFFRNSCVPQENLLVRTPVLARNLMTCAHHQILFG
jgi:hypothetical protein